MSPDLLSWVALCPAAFFAGMVDAVAGGGGLIQVPVLLDTFPALTVAMLFGTNKLAAFVGTASACWRYTRTVSLPWKVVGPAALLAFAGAWQGAALVTWLPRDWARPLVLALLIGAALYTFLKKDLDRAQARAPQPGDRARAAGLGLLIGLYDGFFGPGTGSLLALGFCRFAGMDLLAATAAAKIVNGATNLGALVFFIAQGQILWAVALTMAAFNLAGAQIGAAHAIRNGAWFIRRAMLVVVCLLIVKLGIGLVTG